MLHIVQYRFGHTPGGDCDTERVHLRYDAARRFSTGAPRLASVG